MNRKFRFWIPGKPPIKRRTRGKAFYTPKATVEDEQRVRTAFLAWYPEIRSSAKFSVEIKIYSNRNFDGDNVEKAVMDGLNKTLWENDRQVRQMFWVILPEGHLDEQEGVWVVALEL